jgi:hypothetical protein|tara:strand:+ start:164 stop:352 length:189 start_codon:yes stop_codon:yes gene_type:complete
MKNKTITEEFLDKYLHERNAAALMRDDIAFLSGLVKADNPDIAKQLERVLENHSKKRKDLNA